MKRMNKPHRNPIEGKPVLVAIDTHRRSCGPLAQLIEAARERGVPVVFADRAATGIATRVDVRPGEYLIRHRRHSVFYGTELAILLRELDASTVILVGGETSVARPKSKSFAAPVALKAMLLGLRSRCSTSRACM